MTQKEKARFRGPFPAFAIMLDLGRGFCIIVVPPTCEVSSIQIPMSTGRNVRVKTLPLAVDPGLSLKDVDRRPKSCNHRKPFPEIVLRTYQGANKVSKTNNILNWPKATRTVCQPDRPLGLHGGAIAEFGTKQITNTEESIR